MLKALSMLFFVVCCGKETSSTRIPSNTNTKPSSNLASTNTIDQTRTNNNNCKDIILTPDVSKSQTKPNSKIFPERLTQHEINSVDTIANYLSEYFVEKGDFELLRTFISNAKEGDERLNILLSVTNNIEKIYVDLLNKNITVKPSNFDILIEIASENRLSLNEISLVQLYKIVSNFKYLGECKYIEKEKLKKLEKSVFMTKANVFNSIFDIVLENDRLNLNELISYKPGTKNYSLLFQLIEDMIISLSYGYKESNNREEYNSEGSTAYLRILNHIIPKYKWNFNIRNGFDYYSVLVFIPERLIALKVPEDLYSNMQPVNQIILKTELLTKDNLNQFIVHYDDYFTNKLGNPIGMVKNAKFAGIVPIDMSENLEMPGYMKALYDSVNVKLASMT